MIIVIVIGFSLWKSDMFFSMEENSPWKHVGISKPGVQKLCFWTTNLVCCVVRSLFFSVEMKCFIVAMQNELSNNSCYETKKCFIWWKISKSKLNCHPSVVAKHPKHCGKPNSLDPPKNHHIAQISHASSVLPSGKRLHNDGNSPCLMGEHTISMGNFQ